MTRRRLDAELVRRGLARSREQAQQLVGEARVLVGGVVATKPATQVDDAAPVVVLASQRGGDAGYVSRGAHKLLGALDHFAALSVEGRRALDAGASTGGFTQVLLNRGAVGVIAVDVGYGQLAWQLRSDPRVTVLERTNIRSITAESLPYRPDLVVGDLSFISLSLVLPRLTAVAADDADLLLMVKPQFEVGRENVGHGVVRDAGLRAGAVRKFVTAARDVGWGCHGVVASPLPGPRGNVEYFVWLSRDAPPLAPDAIERAVEEGPA